MYEYDSEDFFDQERAPVSYIRIFHASPNAPAVDVYENNNLIARNLAYRSFTQYLTVTPGQHTIVAYSAGTKSNPVVTMTADIAANTIATIAVIGQLPSLSLKVMPEDIIPIPPGKLYIRFGHLSPTAPRVDIALPDGTKLFSNVGYGEVTSYIAVNPGNYTVEARVAGTSQVVLYVPNIVLGANRFLSIYAIGLPGGNPPLQVVIPMDGNTYLKL